MQRKVRFMPEECGCKGCEKEEGAKENDMNEDEKHEEIIASTRKKIKEMKEEKARKGRNG